MRTAAVEWGHPHALSHAVPPSPPSQNAPYCSYPGFSYSSEGGARDGLFSPDRHVVPADWTVLGGLPEDTPLFWLYRGLSPAQAEFSYLNTARTLELYGVELHYARVSVSVYVCVSHPSLVSSVLLSHKHAL